MIYKKKKRGKKKKKDGSPGHTSWLWMEAAPVAWVGLAFCYIFLVGELAPVFWLMELDLIFLKGSAVSSSRFWCVYGFSMPLGIPSGFRSVRCVYFHRHFKVTLSAYIHCRQPPTCFCDHCHCFCSPVLPCTAGQNLPGRGFCQRRQWHPTPVLLPAKSHGLRSLVDCSPWGR